MKCVWFLFQFGEYNICDIVREHEETTVVHQEETLLKKLEFKELQVLVRFLNNGTGARSYEDGQQFLIKYVRKNCVCLK